MNSIFDLLQAKLTRKNIYTGFVLLGLCFGIFALSVLGDFKNSFKDSDVSNIPNAPKVILDPLDAAKVGDMVITKVDVEYKIRIEEAYGNTKANAVSVLPGLILNAQEYTAAKKYNVLPSADDMREFEKHVDTTTKAPELLTTIKTIFQNDTTSYERLFLLPEMVNIQLHTYFGSQAVADPNASSTITKARDALLGGQSDTDVAAKFGLVIQKRTVTFSKGPTPNTPKLTTAPSPQAKSGATNKVGDVGPVYQSATEFGFAKVSDISGQTYTYEIFALPKPSYDTWFAQEVQLIPVSTTTSQ
jgi:hypothetical protein